MIQMKAPCLLLAPILLLPDGSVRAGTEVQLSPLQVEGDQDEAAGDPVGASIPAYQRFALPRSVAAVQTLERADIEALRPRDVSDLIEGSLGMSIGRQGARVHNFSYNRGDKVSIILDGVYLTQTEAQRVLGDLPVEMIDSVRFLRDASVITISPLMDFGSANAGSPNQGFILIETRKSGPGKDGGELKTSYASYDTRKTLGFLGDSWLDGRLTLGGGYQRSESNGKPNWNMAYAADTWLANAGWKDEQLIASASFFLNKASREIQRAEGTYTGSTRYPVSGPTHDGVLDKNIWKYAPMDTRVIAVNLARPWNDYHTTALTYGWTEAKGTRYAYTTTTDKSTVAGSDAKDRAREWNLSHTVATAKNTFKVGAQTVEWYQLSEGSDSPREEKVYGVYTTLEHRITAAWSVDAAFRLDRKRIVKGGDKYLANGSKAELSDDEWTDDATLFSLGSAWQIDPVWRLSARYSFNRTPTPDVITTRNDEKLPAEKRHRYELGLNAHFGRALQLSLTPFYYVLRNAKVSDGSITSDADGNPIIDSGTGEETSITVYKAVDEVIRKGFEVSFQGRLGGAWSYELGWTYYDANDEDGQTGSEVPDNKYNARLGWQQGPWSASLSAVRVDSYLSYGYTVGDFTTVNLNLTRELGHGVSVALFGQNLADERYATNNKGYPATANWGVLRDVGATYGTELRFRF